jgi:hypothetical protein
MLHWKEFTQKNAPPKKDPRSTRVFRDLQPLKRSSGSTFMRTGQTYNCHTVTVSGNLVTSETHATNPWGPPASVLGKVVKTIDTGRIKSDGEAASVVQAQLELMRGKNKDPTLEACQLTTAFWFNTTAYLPIFVIYKPSAKQ